MPMLSYYALYQPNATDPSGIMVTGYRAADGSPGERPWHAMRWSHRQQAWVYDPAGASRMLADHDSDDRVRLVDRETAVRLAPTVTGGEKLPDEDTILWIFQHRGTPPQ